MFEKWFQTKTSAKNESYYKTRCLELAAEIDKRQEEIEYLKECERILIAQLAEERCRTVIEFAKRMEDALSPDDTCATAAVVEHIHSVAKEMTGEKE